MFAARHEQKGVVAHFASAGPFCFFLGIKRKARKTTKTLNDESNKVKKDGEIP